MNKTDETDTTIERKLPSSFRFSLKTCIFVTVYISISLAILRNHPSGWYPFLILMNTATLVGFLFPVSYRTLNVTMWLLCVGEFILGALIEVRILFHNKSYLFTFEGIGFLAAAIVVYSFSLIIPYFFCKLAKKWKDDIVSFRVFSSGLAAGVTFVAVFYYLMTRDLFVDMSDFWFVELSLSLTLLLNSILNLFMLLCMLLSMGFGAMVIIISENIPIRQDEEMNRWVSKRIDQVAPICSLGILICLLVLRLLP